MRNCRPTPSLLPLPLVVLGLGALACVDETPASDVRGNYSLAFDDVLTLKLNVGGVDHEASAREGETVSFEVNGGPVELNLAELCAREDVQCPSETLWSEVSIDQPQIAAENPNTHVINVIDNTVRDLPAGQSAQVVSGLVDEKDNFGLILGGANEGSGDCGLLALSTASGRFTHEGESEEPCAVADAGSVDGGDQDPPAGDAGPEAPPCTRLTWPPGAPVSGIGDGKIKLGYLGVCALGPALVGATLEITTGFSGTRTGELDPPPYTPLDPATVDDGMGDAGTADGDAG